VTDSWQSVPIVFVRRPKCPHCGRSRGFMTVRSEAGGDGSTSRKSICKSCSRRCVIVVEDPEDDLPQNGNDT
jgi:hypothetical protein